MEVDVPQITKGASLDAHIDLIAVEGGRQLISSPEYGMKRLIAEGAGDIYQLSHVFRRGEFSPLHNPEFTMAEWYRLNISLKQMIEETAGFVSLFLGHMSLQIISYSNAFKEAVGICPHSADEALLLERLKSFAIVPYSDIFIEGKDALLNLLWGAVVEPYLKEKEGMVAVVDYPATQAALAKVVYSEEAKCPVAARFELYSEGVELANGYDELGCGVELEERFFKSNQLRRQLGKESLPIDQAFLLALKSGSFPECTGVAVGFDRLMQLRHSLETLSPILPFSWDVA